MAMLLFKGEALTVKATHNVISEFIRMTDSPFMEVMQLSGKDPMGWTRDMIYCSLRVYNPDLLIVEEGEGSRMMTKYEVGDELFKLSIGETTDLMKALLDDFIALINPPKGRAKEVASEKK